jgi:adenylyltransferase/sulfurtransferase
VAALRVLLREPAGRVEPLVAIDVWQGSFRTLNLGDAKRPDCLTCGQQRFPHLDATDETQMTSLCGRNAVQVRSKSGGSVDLSRIADKLSKSGRVHRSAYLLRCDLSEPRDLQLTVFPDGRAIVHGTSELDRARSIYSRFIGD